MVDKQLKNISFSNWVLGFALFAGGLLRLWLIFSNHYLSPDGAHYASLGYHLIHSGQYVSNGSQFPDIIQPPLYPLFLGLLSLLFKPLLAGKLVSFVFGLGLIVLVYRFVERLSQNGLLAGVTALLVSFNPAFVSISAQVATESLYFFLLFLAFVWLLFYLNDEQKRNKRLLSGAALAVGFAYLTRPETVSYIFMIMLILIIWKRKFRALITFSTIILMFVVVYSLFVFLVSGKVSVYPKIKFVRLHSRISRFLLAEDQKAGRQFDFKMHLNRVRYSLNSSGDEILANALFNRTETLAQVTNKKTPKIRQLKQFLKFARVNFGKALKKFLWGLILPPGYLLFLLIGFLKFRWKKHKGLGLYCCFFILPTFLVLMANVEQRFMFFPGLILMPMVAYGLMRFSELVFKSVKNVKRQGMALSFLLFLVVLTALPGYAQAFRNMRQNDYYYSAGRWLKSQIGQQATVGATVPQAVYFSGLKYVVLPFAPLDSLQLYLLKKQVDFILIESKDRLRRPWQLEPPEWPVFLNLVGIKQFDDQKIFLLRVKKE